MLRRCRRHRSRSFRRKRFRPKRTRRRCPFADARAFPSLCCGAIPVCGKNRRGVICFPPACGRGIARPPHSGDGGFRCDALLRANAFRMSYGNGAGEVRRALHGDFRRLEVCARMVACVQLRAFRFGRRNCDERMLSGCFFPSFGVYFKCKIFEEGRT